MPWMFGSYDVVEKLGEGGMAEVFLAERQKAGGFRQRVALKTIHPRWANDEVLLERFVTEARTNARLAHSNIVNVLDFGTEPKPFIAFEYIDGVSLRRLVHRMYDLRQKLDVAASMFIAVGIAQALDYAHKLRDEDGTPLGIVHRDVSPANLLVAADGTPYVMDFGLVQVADNTLEAFGAAPVGTFCYMAPEQLAGGHVDSRADLFSLGVVLHEMLTSRQLIPTNDPKAVRALHAAADFKRPSLHNTEVPHDLDELTLQCLKVDPEARPPSAEAVSVALQRMLHNRAPGYGREQLSKTVRWAFPERHWERDPGNRPAAQPDPEDRARLAGRERRSLPDGASAKARDRALTAVGLALVLAATAVVSFAAGALWMAYG